MATNETSLKEAVKLLLEKYGQLSTTEVKSHLHEVIDFDDEDLLPSSTRNESKVIQRIGNIVSHQTVQAKDYLGSYRIEKHPRPINAVWTLLSGINGSQQPISKTNISKRRQRKSQFKPVKTDWSLLNEEHSNFGRAGEEFVVRSEQSEIETFSPADVIRVVHLSALQGDGAGFDILSIDKLGNPISIEVKTTSGGLDTPFYMTENERQYFEINKSANDLFLYRVYNFNIANNGANALIKKITPAELFNKYNFDPTNYKVSPK
ncbi:DUF3883 domain-containing protein [Leuconostoc mesenteroides]|uniref:DUF3883 domain-containing protein n=1 Tax=Leuconostoc mesenteroides TaxID=1245 RepID=UPI002362028D|nr:DUF3883 domain-containing protein [Leuconostoc mesenteroides]